MILLLVCLAFQESVENDFEPVNSLALEVVHEITLGQDMEDDNQIFTAGASGVGDEKGVTYVADPGNHRISVFGENGSFVRHIGRQGQGPGEFQEPTAICLDQQGNLAVFDTGSKQLSFFGPDGALLRTVTFEPGIQAVFNPTVLANGNIATVTVKTDARAQITNDVSIYDPDMKLVKQLLSIPQAPKDWSQAGDPNFWVGFLKDQFDSFATGFPLLAGLGNDGVLVTRTNEYVVQETGSSGEAKRSITKKLKPLAFTESAQLLIYEGIWQSIIVNPFLEPNLPKPVFEKALAKTEMPAVMPPVAGIFSLGSGFATVVNFDPDKDQGQLDLFDNQGRCIGSASYSGPSASFYGRGNRFYASGLDEEDNVVVSRFLLKGKAVNALSKN